MALIGSKWTLTEIKSVKSYKSENQKLYRTEVEIIESESYEKKRYVEGNNWI